VNLTDAKTKSEKAIRALGGRVCDWLPQLDRSEARDSSSAADRALAMHALLQVPFGAPLAVLEKWLHANNLTSALSRRELRLLRGGDSSITEQDRAVLHWYLEALWAMAWAGGLIPALAIDQPVGNTLAGLLPNIKRSDSAEPFRGAFQLRPFEQLYRMLDLYFRAHWYARDGQLNGYPTGPFKLDIIMERRKTLEWLVDRSIEDWDDTPQDT
jgi:hypothetical protein